jgi:hypothetical protein
MLVFTPPHAFHVVWSQLCPDYVYPFFMTHILCAYVILYCSPYSLFSCMQDHTFIRIPIIVQLHPCILIC